MLVNLSPLGLSKIVLKDCWVHVQRIQSTKIVSQSNTRNKNIMCMHVKACLEIFCNFFIKLFSRHFPDS